jgi:gliding motility-associated-like protein
MNDQNPIDSLFRNALREAEVPAPDGVLQAVQSQLPAATAATVSGTGLLAKASIWVLAAGAVATAVWWNVDSQISVEPKVLATETLEAAPAMPADDYTEDDGVGFEPNRMNDESARASRAVAEVEMDTARQSTPVASVTPQTAMETANPTRRSEPVTSVVSKPVSCKGSAQGRLSDLAGGCIQFESIVQNDAHSYWRLDGEQVNANRGTHCPNFGQRDRVSLVLILRHSTGCVDSQVFWVQAPKVEIPNYVIPDVITPNGDGLNDQFYVEFDRYPERYELLIFDQLNRLVFRSENPRESWRAQCYQTPCPAGLYRVVLTTQFEGQSETKVNRQPLLIKK